MFPAHVKGLRENGIDILVTIWLPQILACHALESKEPPGHIPLW